MWRCIMTLPLLAPKVPIWNIDSRLGAATLFFRSSLAILMMDDWLELFLNLAIIGSSTPVRVLTERLTINKAAIA